MSTVAVRQAMALHPLIAAPYKDLVSKSVERWTKRSGHQWAANRSKDLIAYLLKIRAGEDVAPIEWFSRKFLAYAEQVSRQGTFSKFAQLIQVWRVFTVLGQEKLDPRPDAVLKFECSCVDPLPRREGTLMFDSNDPRAQIPWFWVSEERSVQECLPEVRLPDVIEVLNPLALRSHDPDGTLSREWEELVSDSWTLQLHAGKMGLTSSWPFALRQIPRLDIMTSREKAHCQYGYIGRVFCRVQKDGKHRFFYAPSQWQQFLLGPWAKSLYAALQRIPQDCTFDQGKGVSKVESWLREGKKVYSFDLSSATDRFPLALSRQVLMDLSRTPNMRMWIDTFSILSRIPAQAGYTGSTLGMSGVQWKVGQPLGAIPSFAVFALTHHAVMRGLYSGDPTTCPYVILGDDLVIADEDLAAKYRSLMHLLGVDISDTNYIKKKIGEFAGRIIDSTGWEYKLKYFHLNYRTLLSMISLIGPRAVRGLPATPLRNVIALLPTPRTPLGCNPGGFPKSKVDDFLISYYASQREEDVIGELWVDKPSAVLARDSALRAVAPYPRLFDTTHAENPRGSSGVGYGGAPEGGARKGFSNWSWSPYLSRSWLQRVKRLAKAAALL